MYRTPGQTDHLINMQEMEGLYLKYISLAKDAEKKEDRVLSEGYYQHAEYYLHAMNDPSDFIPAAAIRSSTQKPQFNTQVKRQEGKVLAYRGTFLRRNRRNIQG